MRILTHRSAAILWMIISVTVIALSLNTSSIYALGDLVSNTSPSPSQVPGTHPWNILIRSDHGNVDVVETGVYYGENTSNKTLRFITNDFCGLNLEVIKNSKGIVTNQNRYNSRVNISYPGYSVDVAGTEICNSSVRVREYPIYNSSLVANYRGSGKYGTTITVRWVSRDLASLAAGKGSSVNFRVQATNGGLASYISSGSKNNSMVSHGSSNPNNFDTIYYPFGLNCDQRTPVSNAPVRVYDVDNGAGGQQGVEVGFFIAELDVHGNMTRLNTGDYATHIDSSSPYNGRIFNEAPDPGPGKRGRVIGTDANRSISIIPGSWNNRGGNTEVRIKSMDPNTRYVLVVERVHENQFIYVQLPGDGIFGSTGFNCNIPPNFTGSASIEGSIGEEFEEGSPATAIASISNSGGSGTASYNQYFWYDANGDGYYRSSDGDASISIPPPRSGTIPINAGATSTLPPIPTTITSNNGAYKQICTSLETSPPGHNSGKCYPIVRRPYFHVYNGDVSAAMRPCDKALNATSSIRAYNRGAPGYEGSGTSIAAYAVGQIEGFTSAMRGTTKPKYLSFANTGLAPANSQFGGGGANAVTSCVSDRDIPATGHSVDGAQASGSDDVFISSNNSYPTTFGIGNIPNHTVTAKGNIYISSEVTELNGVFKAGRNIYTCATAAGVLPNKSDTGPDGMTQKCSKQLVVNGALIASNVYLMRTTGSLISPNPAEKITLSPEAWIKSLVDGGTTGKKLNTQYDAILNMPPVL